MYRKAFLPVVGRLSKLERDSLIAAYKLVVLIARSVAKSSRCGASGSVEGVKWAAAAVKTRSVVCQWKGFRTKSKFGFFG